MRTLILCFCFAVSALLGKAQSDTLYYDEYDDIADRSAAKYFALPPVPQDSLYLLTEYYTSTGKMYFKGLVNNMTEQRKYGYVKYYDSTGHVSNEGSFAEGRQEGRWLKYFEGTDQLERVSYYSADWLNGTDTVYYASGKLRRYDVYKDNECTSGEVFTENGEKIKYYPYQILPKYTRLGIFLANHIRYPKKAVEYGIEGKVIIRFWVLEDGTTTRFKVVRSVDPLLDAEALRVIKAMGKWQPGTIDKKPVKVVFTQPITFKLS